MGIFTRPPVSLRLLVCLAVSLVLALPAGALARSTRPARAFAPAKALKAHASTKKASTKAAQKKAAQKTRRRSRAEEGRAEDEEAQKKAAQQRVVTRAIPEKAARQQARPIGSATLEGQKPTAPQQPVVAPPVALPVAPAAPAAPAPVAASAPAASVSIPPSVVPTVDPTLAQVAQITQEATQNNDAAIRVIVYGTGASAALTAVGATDVQELTLIGAAGRLDQGLPPLRARSQAGRDGGRRRLARQDDRRHHDHGDDHDLHRSGDDHDYADDDDHVAATTAPATASPRQCRQPRRPRRRHRPRSPTAPRSCRLR